MLVGQGPIDDYWENMTYPDFHRMYRCKLGKNVCKSDVQSRKLCSAPAVSIEISSMMMMSRVNSHEAKLFC